MARIATTMSATGSEPKECTRKFQRGETMYAVVFNDGSSAGWHTKECIENWEKTDCALCEDE